MSNEILIARESGVLTITINRPERKNALTPAMYQAMADELAAAQEDAAVRAVLVRGHAEIFTAGNDIEDFLKSPPTLTDSPVGNFLKAIAAFEKPLVAAVAGAAIGVGTTLLLHCDLVYAADTARFAMPFAQLGLCPEAASSLLLPRVAGYQGAAEKLLLGDAFDAAEAHRMGFVNRVLPAAELDAFVAAQLAKLVALPASSLRVTKALMKRASAHEVAKQMEEEGGHFRTMLVAPEAREAFTAFLQKRKPDFRQFD
ncbi:2,3-dehydroadipyl-CoA hydratase [Paraburkholderia caffeinitolerans]|uniref:2,3-dehydroadipyl-CoA hydratase n=1 Tax=Paraburkholderia caffeinitolerans TaxID=1723730 RepID=A0A6J5GXM4_9BURK|nr:MULTISPECIES: enoyl-CoA hydratase [Paraburkholderia]CAB3806729.1 2,3-dehydroadipyl-CoA hydratase [Paraburkholderia caffeinitolerans]